MRRPIRISKGSKQNNSAKSDFYNLLNQLKQVLTLTKEIAWPKQNLLKWNTKWLKPA